MFVHACVYAHDFNVLRACLCARGPRARGIGICNICPCPSCSFAWMQALSDKGIHIYKHKKHTCLAFTALHCVAAFKHSHRCTHMHTYICTASLTLINTRTTHHTYKGQHTYISANPAQADKWIVTDTYTNEPQTCTKGA